jgi:hypothetical protein
MEFMVVLSHCENSSIDSRPSLCYPTAAQFLYIYSKSKADTRMNNFIYKIYRLYKISADRPITESVRSFSKLFDSLRAAFESFRSAKFTP